MIRFTKMEARNLRILLVCMLLVQCTDEVPISGIVTIGKTVFNVFSFGYTIVGMLESPGENNNEQVLEEVKTTLASFEQDIRSYISLQSKLDRINDAVVVIHSLLVDLQNIFLANKTSDRERFESLYSARFESNDAVKHVRFLPELLTYKVSGETMDLLELFAENTRCNMTAILDFKFNYYSLVSSGIALQLAHIKLASLPAINVTIAYWDTALQRIYTEFDEMVNKCKSKLRQYVIKDITTAPNVFTLRQNNDERYSWMHNNVYFLEPNGMNQFFYDLYIGNYICSQNSDLNKIVMFSDKNETYHEKTWLSKYSEQLKTSIIGKRDANSAKHIGVTLKDRLKEDGYISKAILVFFHDNDHSSASIALDADSPVLHLSLDGIELSYCDGTWFHCAIDFLNSSGKDKHVRGSMQIYAYIVKDNAENSHYGTYPYKTSGAEKVQVRVLIFTCIIAMFYL